MANRERLLALLADEVRLSANYVTENRLDDFHHFNKKIGKLVEILEEMQLPSEVFNSPEAEQQSQEPEREKAPDEVPEPIDTTTLYGLFKQDLPKVVDKFWEKYPDVTETDIPVLFDKFVTKRAQYTSQGFPANDIAEKLKLFQGDIEDEVDLTAATDKLTTKLEIEEEKEKEVLIRGTFIQGLRGGQVGPHHIHEGLVRSLQLDHGRHVTLLDKPSAKAPFTIIREETVDDAAPTNQVKTLDYALIEQDEFEKLIIRETIYGEEISDLFSSHTYWQVPDDTIHNLRLSDGDIVELHYYEGDYESLTVNYVYSSAGNKKVETAKKRYANDKKEKIIDADAASNDYLFDLQGTRVLIVGAEPYWGKWRTIIEDHNGAFDAYDKHSPNRTVLSSKVQNADIVIAIKNLISHASWWAAKDFAKEFNVPYQMVSGFGNGIIFRLIGEHFPNLLEVPTEEETEQETSVEAPQEKAWQEYADEVLTGDVRQRALPKELMNALKDVFDYAVKQDYKSKAQVSQYLLDVFEARGFNRKEQRRMKKVTDQMRKDAGIA